MSAFPFGVAAYLEECRRFGFTFDQAWTFGALDRWARRSDFGRTNLRPFSVESPLTFAKRHLRATFEGREALRYCEEDCPYLALFEGHCALHTHEERIAS